MEVGGKTPDRDVSLSSDQWPPDCHPCSSDGKRIQAEGYCETCNDFLCETCYKAHTIPKGYRHHVLLDKSSMPHSAAESQREPNRGACTLPCPDHNNKIIEYYCPVHDSVVCCVCAVLKHKSCTVNYIPNLDKALTYQDSAEYRQLRTELDNIHKDVTVSIDDVKENKKSIGHTIKAQLDNIRQFKMDVIAYADKREKELLAQGRQFEQEDTAMMQTLKEDLVSLKEDIESSTYKLTSLQNETCNLFAASNQTCQMVSVFHGTLTELMAKNKTPDYCFKRDDALQQMMSSNGTFGKFERSYQTRHIPLSVPPSMSSVLDIKTDSVTKLPAINTRTPSDKRTSWITGLTLLHPGTLLAADFYNTTLKEIDVTTNTVTSQLSLTSEPGDITLLPGDQAAVTLPGEKKIQFISTKGRLSCLGSISVSGHCYGIGLVGYNLVVSYSTPSKVEIMEYTGRVIKTITTDNSGYNLFSYPRSITVGREKSGEMIYVSDSGTNTITKLSVKGKILGTYKHKNWCHIFGLTCVGEGQVLVCNGIGNTVDVVSDDGKDIVTLLDSTHGIEKPRALCYCPSQATLYVSSGISGKPISVFKLSKTS